MAPTESAIEGRAVPGPSLQGQQEETPAARRLFSSQAGRVYPLSLSPAVLATLCPVLNLEYLSFK